MNLTGRAGITEKYIKTELKPGSEPAPAAVKKAPASQSTTSSSSSKRDDSDDAFSDSGSDSEPEVPRHGIH